MVKRQKHRSNYHTDNPEKYFKISVFLPFLDNLVQQLNDRFINHKTIIAGFYFLISNKNYNQQAIKDLSEFYSDDIDQEVIETEVKLWHTHLEKLSIKSVLDALDNCNKDLFPNVFKLLQIFATLPVTSCEHERSFSTLKRIKTYLRNSISQFRLNGLASLNIHRVVEVTVE